MRENFTTGSVPVRKAYLRSLIDRIEVDDHQVRIKGRKDLLEKAVLASRNNQAWCSETSTRWRARREDLTASRNPCFYCITGTPAALSDTTKVSHRQPISSHIGADEGKLRARPIIVEIIGISARYDLSFVAQLYSARQLSKGLHTRLCLAPKEMCLLDDLVGAG